MNRSNTTFLIAIIGCILIAVGLSLTFYELIWCISSNEDILTTPVSAPSGVIMFIVGLVLAVVAYIATPDTDWVM